MKVLLSLATLISLSSFAAPQFDLCLGEAKKSFLGKNGPRGARSVENGYILKTGETIKDLYKNDIKSFDQNVVVYRGTGSYYSGWFEYAIALDPATCEHLGSFETYSE
ncbi:hypothetical protein HBN50_02840 [Halobacteriovorax sp. GB3]|uniref:hypothetical protein n=1 Tax=Halobacteriovorax sp. GB3 TaxID=2719615 RepID=UPI0023611FD5|nr:hypothetical protein [Halobacteriovorax sp. GB3]MDD0852012.1 hypothetical protein [Halobacteriovorax sp. GB3]